MRHPRLTPNPLRYAGRHTTRVLTLALAASAALAIAPAADATARTHKVKLDSTMFAAQVGSTTTGASVYAGAVPDRTLGHGAIVFNASGTTTLHVDFQEFFALGSIKGTGSVTVVPGTGGQATLTGTFKVTGGTAKYRHARGKLTAAGTINDSGMVMATLRGSFTS
jgi:hypothetical protein